MKEQETAVKPELGTISGGKSELSNVKLGPTQWASLGRWRFLLTLISQALRMEKAFMDEVSKDRALSRPE